MEDALMVPQQQSNIPCAVILTALPVEYIAVRSHLTNLQDVVHPNGTIYERGTFTPDWDVAIVEVGTDNFEAASEAKRAIAYFNPDLILFVGVGLGIKDVEIGDVVAATKIYGYEGDNNEKTYKSTSVIRSSAHILLQRAKAESRKPDWLKRRKKITIKSSPSVFVAPIAAGNRTIFSIGFDLPDFLESTYKDAIALEIEGSDFLNMDGDQYNIPSIVIRGIANRLYKLSQVNLEKYLVENAASNASAFAFEILSKLQWSKTLTDNNFNYQHNLSQFLNQFSIERILESLLAEDKLDSSELKNLAKKLSQALALPDNKYRLFNSIVREVIETSEKPQNFVISSIEIFNIRCFEKLNINLEKENHTNNWIMLLGNNAVGKSTLLKAIALGLCKESDAVALIKEMPGDFLREGTNEGYIKINLRQDTASKDSKKYSIVTKIERNPEDTPEIIKIRQETESEAGENFPWADIFVCGYGAYRSKQADTSYERYKSIDAVRSLFNIQTSLQNPEVILLRQAPEVRAILEEKLKNILMLDIEDYEINYSKRGLEIEGPWGRMPFQTLSDGYRSTTIWVLDFLGWLIYAERLIGNPDIGGILIIDEIEQHLHPRWQRYIVQRLRQQFPKTQIIASTHTPLVAAGIADVDRSMLLKLDRNDENEITVQIIDKELIAGKRADQVLTSEAFGLVTTRNNRSHDDVDRYTELLGKQTRTDAEAAALEELRSIVQSRLSDGETATSQIVEKAVDEALQGIITNVSPEMLDVETKKQLRALFQSES
jgi:predicted ATP-binding protein involved in virulence/nucleoside phosphorylase